MNISNGCPEYYKSMIKLSFFGQEDLKKAAFRSSLRRDELDFSYGHVTYDEYLVTYNESQMNYLIPNEQAIRGRKWIAIPNALLAGVGKTTYDLAIAVFKAYNGDFRACKVHLYCFARDLEEAYGWLVTLFDDVLGSYHVQQSLFRKNCYSYFEESKNRLDDFSKKGIAKITLKDFHEMSELVREEVLDLFHLGTDFQSLFNQNEAAFFERLSHANQKALALVSLGDVGDFRRTKIEYALMSDAEFKALTLKQLLEPGELDGSNDNVVSQRLKYLADEPACNEIPEDIMNTTLGQFYRLPVSRISELDVGGRRFLLRLLSDDQIQSLNVEWFTMFGINQGLFGFDFWGGLEEEKEAKRRFGLLSGVQVQAILGYLDQTRLNFLSDAQIQPLDLTCLLDWKIDELMGMEIPQLLRDKLAGIRQDPSRASSAGQLSANG